MSPPLGLWAWAFAVTVVLEVPVYAVLLRDRLGWRGALVVGLMAQVTTHPALWYVVPRFQPWLAWVLVAEIGVTLVEAALVLGVLRWAGAEWSARTAALALGTSLLANAISTLAGLVSYG